MTWEVATDSKKHVKAIADALKDDPDLILATDPDREGEAISWHLKEALEKRKAIKKDTTVRRVTFNAITKDAVTQAMAEPRDVDMELVEAYLARRALDYLVGFTLSPVLWRKLPGAKSAGRVQSVALGSSSTARWRSRRSAPANTGRCAPCSKRRAARASRPASWPWAARSSTATTSPPRPRRGWPSRPSPPARCRHGGGGQARHAQPLAALHDLDAAAGGLAQVRLRRETDHEHGAASLRGRAHHLHADRRHRHGARGRDRRARRDRRALRRDYVPGKPRIYKNKAKNAQEAHECIRPTDMAKAPGDLKLSEDDQRKLYDLIWKRTIASQMEAARLERTTITWPAMTARWSCARPVR
jgi:DNA topoisomerase-1